MGNIKIGERYGGTYTLREDKHQTTLVSTYHMLTYWKTNDSGGSFNRPLSSNDVSLATKTSGRDKGSVKCFTCGDLGHVAYECPSKANNPEKLNTTVDSQIEKGQQTSINVSNQSMCNTHDEKSNTSDAAAPQGQWQFEFLTTASLLA